MKSKSIVADKSFAFAKNIVKVYKHLKFDHNEFELSKQLVKSGTSIRANIQEALGAQSDADFLNKISISYKEARECHYWVRLLNETDLLPDEHAEKLIPQIEELTKMLGSIQLSMRRKLNRLITTTHHS